MAEQNFANHTKIVPAFHLFVLPVFAANFIWSIFRWRASGFSIYGFFSIVVAATLVVAFVSLRLFALRVQDRVIRLEERLRCERLLPSDLHPRIVEFTPAQFVGLRFASDAEFPDLARKVLDEKLTNTKQIKQLVKNWKPDYLRA